MLDTFPVAICVSALLGFLAGIGVGGGSLLILWLTLVLDMPNTEARIINLLFFIPSALIASLFRWRQGDLSLRKILPAIIAGSISAGVFSLLSRYLDFLLLKKLFAGLLIFTGIRELMYKEKKQEH